MGTELMTVTEDRATWPASVVTVLEAMEGGRTYSEAMLSGAAEGGVSLSALRREVRRWREESPFIATAFLVLEAERADGWLDEVIDIADMAAMDNVSIAHANLRINTRFRIAELRARERYGPASGSGGGEGSVTVNLINLASDGVKVGIMGKGHAALTAKE